MAVLKDTECPQCGFRGMTILAQEKEYRIICVRDDGGCGLEIGPIFTSAALIKSLRVFEEKKE